MSRFGVLKIDVLSAQLSAVKDAYCIVTLPDIANKSLTTPVVRKDHPDWGYSATLPLTAEMKSTSVLMIEVKDKRMLADELLGRAKVPLEDISQGGKGMRREAAFTEGSHAPNGSVIIMVEWVSLPAALSQGGRVQDGVEAAVGAVANSHIGAAVYNTVGSVTDVVRDRAKVPLPPCEGQTFNVRVIVHKARNLQSTSADARFDPLVEISLAKQRKSTEVAKKTNNPIWEDEVFLCYENVDAGFWNETFSTTVLDHRVARSNMVIGLAMMDLGSIYTSNREHTLRKKWFPLVKSATNGLVMGYVKLTICVLNTKTDQMPEFEDDEDDEEEEDDIVSNLIDLPGARFDEIALIAKIIEAEGLPAMDSMRVLGNGDLCDPYCMITNGKSTTKTVPILKTYAPKWNTVKSLNMLVPSMTPFINVSFWDQDYPDPDDLIATVRVDARKQTKKQGGLDADSQVDMPYLPLQWRNLYGPVDDGTNKYYMKQARGDVQGSTYRGRALFGLSCAPKDNAQQQMELVKETPYDSKSEVEVEVEIHFLTLSVIDSGSYYLEASIGPHKQQTPKLSSVAMASRASERNAMHCLPSKQVSEKPTVLTARFRVVMPRDEDGNVLDLAQVPDLVIHLYKSELLSTSLYAFYRVPASQLVMVEGGRTDCVQMVRNVDLETVGEGEMCRTPMLQFFSCMVIKPHGDALRLPPNMNSQMGHFKVDQSPKLQQLRAYVHQARYLPSGDDNGLSDPYVKVIFGNGWYKNDYMSETIAPIFDETLPIDAELRNPYPDIQVEVWDYDTIGRDTFLGRARIPVEFSTDPSKARRFHWHKLSDYRGRPQRRFVGEVEKDAEVLIALELVSMRSGNTSDLPLPVSANVPRKLSLGPRSPHRKIITMPPEMTISTQTYNLDFFLIGLRAMKKLEFLELQNPSVSFEIAGVAITTPRKDGANANFLYHNTISVVLPTNPDYMPPMSIQVFDHRLGRRVLAGTSLVDIGASTYDPEQQCELINVRKQARDQRLHSLRGSKRQILTGKKKAASLKGVAKGIAALGGIRKRTIPPDAAEAGEGAAAETHASMGPASAQPSEDEDEDESHASGLARPLVPMKKHRDPLDKIGAGLGKLTTVMGLTGPQPLDVPSDDDRMMMSIDSKTLTWFDKFDPPNDISGALDPNDLVTRIHKHTRKGAAEMRGVPSTAEGLFGPFDDGAVEMPLHRGQGSKEVTTGRVKWCMALSKQNAQIQSPVMNRTFEEVPYMARIYVLTCTDLAAKDDSIMGKFSDPYLKLSIGGGAGVDPTRVIKDKDNKKFSTLNPEFFTMYEMDGILPRDNTLRIDVFDFDQIGFDELIGSTEINLEDRYYSAFGYSSGELPTGGSYTEKRDLLDRHGGRQGRIEMWVDMFPMKCNIPRPIDVKPPPPLNFELRVVVWNTRNVIMQETSINGEEMTDIYVRAWVKGLENMAQETDVHYRSLDGTGNFNWRMIFPFVYFPRYKKIASASKKNTAFSLFRVRKELKPWKPILYLQIYDDDLLPGTDDFIGECTVDLNNVIPTLTQRVRNNLLETIVSDAMCLCSIWPFSLCFERCKPTEASGELSLQQRQELARLEAERERNARNRALESQLRSEIIRKLGSEDSFNRMTETEKIARMKEIKRKMKINIFNDFNKKSKSTVAPGEKVVGGKDGAEDGTVMAKRPTLSDESDALVYESPRYWFACTAPNGGNRVGDVQVSFQLVRASDDGTLLDPKQEAGKGRSEPNKMPEPNRPDSSFFWLSSPFKSAVHILWKNYKWWIIAVVCLIISAVFVYVFLQTGVQLKAEKFFT
eukprot:PhM_4_TR11334/c0_g1_i1/m.103946